MGRTTATILFTDLVGSTELRGRLGEEAADQLRRKHDDLLVKAVEANNGRVVKGLGDGIMAAFAGAADAVSAAVAIQQAVDRLNRSGRVPEPVAMRIGLSAGDVSVEDDDVHGTPVIEASRLCAMAGGGQILSSELVRGLAGRNTSFGFDAQGPIELKGLSVPVAACRVVWEPAPRAAIPMPALLTDVGRIFVGRDAELERLNQLWKEAAAGERRVVLVAGEPGVGKTRLTAEQAARVHENGSTVLSGRCDEDLGVPYQPFVEALRHFVDHTADLSGRLGRYGGELARLVPELTELVSDLPAALRSDPETERYRLFDGVAAWLAAVSSEEPLLLVVDDLQWAAKPTLLLLRHLVRSAEPMAVLIVGTYRDTDLGHDHPLVEILADLRRGGAVRLSLTGLDELGVASFVEQAAGHDLDEDAVALTRAIHEETEGNPFFVKEVLRHLAESGAIARREGRWGTRQAVDELGIPEGVREVVGKRLARLSDATNRVLRTAAVVGAAFEPAVVQSAGDCDDEELMAALEEGSAARLVIEADDGRYRFAHALVRDTLYDGLSAVRRAALHRRVAEAIEALHGKALDNHLPALAHHWARAATPAAEATRAVDYAVRAGHRALAQLAHDEAAKYYHQALELLAAGEGDGDEPRRLEILLVLGEAQRRAGDPAHRDVLLAAGRLARRWGDAEALARAALSNTRGMFMGNFGSVDADRVEILEAALAAVGQDDTPIRARLLATLALELTFAGQGDRHFALSDEALAIARRVDEPATLVSVLLARYYTIYTPATLSERLANTAEGFEIAKGVEDPVVRCRAALLRIRCLAEIGELEESTTCLEMAQTIARELGQPALLWATGWNSVGRLAQPGRLQEAEQAASAALAIGEAGGQPDAFLFYAVQMYFLRREQGRLGEVDGVLRDVADRWPTFPMLRLLLAHAYCEQGRTAEAQAIFKPLSAGRFASLPFDLTWMVAMSASVEVADHLGDHASAAVLYELLTPYADQVPTNAGVAGGAASHYLGRLAAMLHLVDAAEVHFRAAVTKHASVGAPTWLARTRLEWARTLLTRGQPSHEERARALLDQALATARELGLAQVERDSVHLLQDCP